MAAGLQRTLGVLVGHERLDALEHAHGVGRDRVVGEAVKVGLLLGRGENELEDGRALGPDERHALGAVLAQVRHALLRVRVQAVEALANETTRGLRPPARRP